MKLKQTLGFENRLGWGYSAMKLAIALVIANIISFYMMDYRPAWIMVTVVVVMLAGEAVELQYAKAIGRIIATVLGGIVGSGVIILHADNVLKIIILSLLVFIFSWARHKKYIKDYTLILGLATYFMVVINKNPTWHIALNRSTEILIGIIISMLVAKLVFPVSIDMVLKILLKKQWGILQEYAGNILIYKKTRTKKDPIILIAEENMLDNHQKIQNLLKSKRKRKRKHRDITYKNYERQNKIQLGIYRYLTSIDCENFTFDTQNIDLYNKEKKIIFQTLRNIANEDNNISKVNNSEIINLEIKHTDIFRNIKTPNEAIEKYSLTRTIALLKEAIKLTTQASMSI